MSGKYPVPIDFSPMSEAMDRARLEFMTDTTARFTGLLISGRLQAWQANERGEVVAILASFWASREAELAIRSDEIRTRPITMSSSSEGRPVFRTSELDAVLPSLGQRFEKVVSRRRAQVSKPVATPMVIKNSGGAPTKFPDEMWVEMFAYLDREDLPKTYAELVDYLLSWQQSRGEPEPGRTGVHDRVKMVMDRIRSDRGERSGFKN